MNLNDFAKEVHENAIAHGWWDEPRSDGTLRALMHAELSEALEEYRANRPMVWHLCKHGGMCEMMDVHQGECGCETCKKEHRKPEGIAVELIDFCIRAMDTMAANDIFFMKGLEDAEDVAKRHRSLLSRFGIFSLPDLVDALHMQVSSTATQEFGLRNLEGAVGAAMAWIGKQGVDPVSLMIEKHEYNKHRPYKHGGKVC